MRKDLSIKELMVMGGALFSMHFGAACMLFPVQWGKDAGTALVPMFIGILLSGVVIKGFSRIKAPGVAVCFSLAMILLLVVIQDAVAWHVIPLVIIAVLAEMIRFITNYNWTGDVISTVLMSFSTFGYYGQIWFNRAYTYECAVEEMPAGYADALMSASPSWALPVVLVIGVLLSVVVSIITEKLFKIEK